MIISPNKTIVDMNGNSTKRMETWMDEMTDRQIILGSGTPETFVAAIQGTLYMDITGASGSLLYGKRDPDISGDISQGWILV